MNQRLLEMVETNRMAEAAKALNDYLVHSERIVLAVYARQIAQDPG